MTQDAAPVYGSKRTIVRAKKAEKGKREKPRELSAATREYHERLAKELHNSGKDELDITENPVYDSNQ